MWGHQFQAGASWNAGPGWKQPLFAILDPILLTLPAKPERSALLPRLTRSPVPKRKPGQDQRRGQRTKQAWSRRPFTSWRWTRAGSEVRSPSEGAERVLLGAPFKLKSFPPPSSSAEAARPAAPCAIPRPVIFGAGLGRVPRGRQESTPCPRCLTGAAKEQEENF